ncbi:MULTISPECIES: tetratricopeptide repeat protein [unclassified Bradyrhizobium]|uniref:tetratricopeptide repeat protein n=1 Tax=unclassified Bradyrhizobium TaxID=2631580 RepID=UPI001FFABABB|nr:tetratricopeptide repeat protein [Bradyrhizobium sp. CW11]MCK1707508.1 tetratricopeptide repeat protein [Bradyrhizobium sp. 146]
MKLTREQRQVFRTLLSPKNSALDVVTLARRIGLDPRTCFADGDWRGVDFGANDLSGFDLRRADLRQADLSRTTGLDKAIIDAGTRLSPSLVTTISGSANTQAKMQAEAEAKHVLGNEAFDKEDFAAALAAYDEAIALFRRAGDLRGEAGCIGGLGNIALARDNQLGSYGQAWMGSEATRSTAREHFEKAMMLSRQAGDLHYEAKCVVVLGEIARRSGDHATARAKHEKARALFRKAGDFSGEADCVMYIGHLASDRSDHATALADYRRAMTLYRRASDLDGEGFCINKIGETALQLADHAAAEVAFEQALMLFRKSGNSLGEADSMMGLGSVALALSNYDASRSAFQKALARYREVGDVDGERDCKASLRYFKES